MNKSLYKLQNKGLIRNPETTEKEIIENYWLEKKRLIPDWTPYCLKCVVLTRTKDREYGYQCLTCNNKIDFKMNHYEG